MGATWAQRAAFALAAGIFSANVGAELAHPDEPGINPNRDYVHQHFAERIDPYNGNLELQYVDNAVGREKRAGVRIHQQ